MSVVNPMEPPRLKRKDFPRVKYWTRISFLEAKKNRKSERTPDSDADISDSENGQAPKNKMTWYVEDSNGKTCLKEKIDAIRQHMRSIWFRLKRDSMAPEKWQKLDFEAQKLFEAEVCCKFPELSYGKDNWKAHQVAQDNYSSWYNKNIKNKSQVKEDSSTIPCKRPGSPDARDAQPKQKSRKGKGKEREAPAVPAFSVCVANLLPFTFSPHQ